MTSSTLHHRRCRVGHGNLILLAANSLLQLVGLLHAASQLEWQKDGREVMQREVEGLEMQPQAGRDLFGNCAHDHLLFAMIRSLRSFGCRHARRGLRRGRNTVFADIALMIGEFQLP